MWMGLGHIIADQNILPSFLEGKKFLFHKIVAEEISDPVGNWQEMCGSC